MVIVVKDLHLKESEPYFSAQTAFLSWIINQEWNNSNNYLIQLGDLFNNSCPTPKEYNLVEKFLSEVNFKRVYLIAGNHDWSDTKKTFSILPLQNNRNTKLILEQEIIEIEGNKCAFLPYKHNYREEYSELSDDFLNADLIFHHLEDETIQFGKNKQGINLSKWRGKRIGGHIHKIQKNYELGMPVQSRFDEKGQVNNLLCISDKEQYIPIPKFLDFYDAMYGEPLPKVEAMFPIWDIHDAPSSSEGRKYYFGNHIRKVFVKNEKKDAVEIKKNQPAKRKTLVEFFQEYIAKRNDLSSSAMDKLKNTISKK